MKEKSLEIEKLFLSPYAKKSAETEGRLRDEKSCAMRTDFQRDRDRIIHSKAFRRLKNKTQVFFAPEGDHYRTRLTHTLTVAQVARSISRALSLNEDLTEAIALGHDLGHTPFGHSGEDILNKLSPHGFKHNEQSGRVVDVLENDGLGLNLTREVVDGIINHKMVLTPKTLEGKAVSYADRIAYLNHDIDDAIESGFITKKDIPEKVIKVLGKTSSQRINNMIYSIYLESDGKNYVKMQDEAEDAMACLRSFLFERVYNNPTIESEAERADKMITVLYERYYKHPEEMPELYVKSLETTDKDVVICDYLSSMSDVYAIRLFKEIFIPDNWKL